MAEEADDMDQKRALAARGGNAGANLEATANRSCGGLPPSADEPGSATYTSTTSWTSTGETHQAARGKKRSSEGDDDDRYALEREEDSEVDRYTGA